MTPRADALRADSQVDQTAAERVEQLLALVRKLKAENEDLKRAKEMGVDDNDLASPRAVDVRRRARGGGYVGAGGGGGRCTWLQRFCECVRVCMGRAGRARANLAGGAHRLRERGRGA